MTTEREEYRYALLKFAESASRLSEAWVRLDNEATDAVSTEYPFDKSFDAMMFDILAWHGSAIDGLRKVSEADGTIRYVEYDNSADDGYKYFCVFNFIDRMEYANVTIADYHVHEAEWYLCRFEAHCDPNKLNDHDYLEKLFLENEDNGFSVGSFDSLKELIYSEEDFDDIENDVYLLNHFCNL